VIILSQFTFSGEMGQALDLMNPFVLGITCADAVTLLQSFSFSGDQLTALARIVNYV